MIKLGSIIEWKGIYWIVAQTGTNEINLISLNGGNRQSSFYEVKDHSSEQLKKAVDRIMIDGEMEGYRYLDYNIVNLIREKGSIYLLLDL